MDAATLGETASAKHEARMLAFGPLRSHHARARCVRARSRARALARARLRVSSAMPRATSPPVSSPSLPSSPVPAAAEPTKVAASLKAFKDDVPFGEQKENFFVGIRHNAMEYHTHDLDGDEKLSYDEFSNLIREREIGVHSEVVLEYRFHELDPGDTGFVHVADYILYSLQDALVRSGLRSLDVFMAFDEDGSGEVSVGEFRKTLRAWGFKVSKAELDAAFAKLDFVDQSGNISYLELHRMLRRRPALPGDKKQREIAIASRQPREYRRGTELEGKLELEAASLEAVEDAQQLKEQLRDLLSRHVTRMMDLLRTWDEDNSGTIDKTEWRQALRSLGVKLKRDAIDGLFDSFDADQSGELDYHELSKYLRPRSPKPQSPNADRLSAAEAARQAMDNKNATKARNLNGLVLEQNMDRSNNMSVVDQLEAAIRRKKVRLVHLFTEWDEDGNGHLTKEELLSALKKLGLTSPEIAQQAVDEIFGKLDKDHSASVDLRELISGLRVPPGPGRRGPSGVFPRQRTLAAPTVPHRHATWDPLTRRFDIPPVMDKPKPRLLRPATAPLHRTATSPRRPPQHVWSTRPNPPARPRTAGSRLPAYEGMRDSAVRLNMSVTRLDSSLGGSMRQSGSLASFGMSRGMTAAASAPLLPTVASSPMLPLARRLY